MLEQHGALLAGIGNLEKMCYWAAKNVRLEPGKEWAYCGEKPIIRSDLKKIFNIDTNIINSPELRRSEKDVFQLHISKELNGKVAGFGDHFWSFISESFPRFAQEFKSGEMIQSIIYLDRYFRSPTHVKILYMLLETLSKNMDEQSKIQIISMTKANKELQQRPFAPWHDWLDDEIRSQVVRQVLGNITSAFANFELRDKQQIQHSRELLIEWCDGNICSLRFDEGIACWGIQSAASFPFEASVKDQAEFIREMEGHVFMRQEELGTYIDCLFKHK